MSSIMAPTPPDVGISGRRTIYSMCGMCAVRCPLEVTVEDGRAVWLQGNPHDKAIGASLCAKGSAGLAFEQDDERPQTPLIRMGPRGGGQWRRASWDEALDHIADKLHETIDVYGGRGIVLSDRGGFFTDLTRTFVQAAEDDIRAFVRGRWWSVGLLVVAICVTAVSSRAAVLLYLVCTILFIVEPLVPRLSRTSVVVREADGDERQSSDDGQFN
jgi:hypothetical protein